MSAPSIRFQLPPRSLFNWPPDPLPRPIPPPLEARTFASPFPIPDDIFQAALDWKVPVTIGAMYATTAITMNKINRDRKNKPWGISKTRAFHYFVLLHNSFLAIFSALTFIGMIRALAHTWPGRRDLPFLGKLWPGLRTQNGLAGAVDALCKLHGPQDLGDAVFYNPGAHAWTTTNRSIKLGSDSNPDTSDIGRLWNEGLAFWGWWFYLSKFYEVLDTFIILVKGKRSSTLQTYHHTGAMACMWAGIRYMSPPIWMFCFINSGIHTLMYTYYTLSALRIRVPQGIKRTLTTMQITQFLVGITFASMHLFVYYSVPVSVPYTLTKTVASAVSAASSAVSSAASAAASNAPEAAAAGVGTMLQKILMRGVGEAGMAQKKAVGGDHGAAIPDSVANATGTVERETKWRIQYEYIPCIDTEGQAFAIWLNVFYLAPLTLLFVRFFIRSYMRRGGPNTKISKPSVRISKAAEDAAHGVDREVDTLGQAAENGVGDLASNVMNKFQGSTPKGSSQRRVSANIERIANQFEKTEEEQIDDDTEADISNQVSRASSDIKIKAKGSSESLKVGLIRRKASEEHNKLRQMFEDGPQAFGRSVESSPKSGPTKVAAGTERQSDKLSPCIEDDDADKEKLIRLEKEAEEKVRVIREASGGQGSRSVEDLMKSSRNGSSLEASRGSDLDFSLIDIRGEQNNEREDITKGEDSQGKEEASSMVDVEKDSEPLSTKVVTNPTGESSKHTKNEFGSDPLSSTSSPVTSSESKHATPLSISDSRPDLPATTRKDRSPSPKRMKSKIPQPTSRLPVSPTKMILTPATTTTSVAAHSSIAFAERKTSSTGKPS